MAPLFSKQILTREQKLKPIPLPPQQIDVMLEFLWIHKLSLVLDLTDESIPTIESERQHLMLRVSFPGE